MCVYRKLFINSKVKNLFSLIELFIVVAIILILMTLIQPALRHAITNAKIAGCLNNLRQMGMVLMLYSDDNNGKYPKGNGTSTRRPGMDGAYFVPHDSYMGIAIPYAEGYFDSPDIMYCPLWEHPFNNLNTLDDQGLDVWARRANAFGGFHHDKSILPTLFVGHSYAYRTSILRDVRSGNVWHVDPRMDGPGTAVMADHFQRRDVLYGQAYGHPNGYGTLYLDNSAKQLEDMGHDYMYTKQPHHDSPRYSEPHLCHRMTHHSWGANTESLWMDFFDKN